MRHQYKKIILSDPDDDRIVMKKEYYSYSILSRVQGWLLYFKIHTGWRLQYLYETILVKTKKRDFAYEKRSIHEKPLVYSCSGCSSAAQMANYLAVKLDRNDIAEMSCIAGVGGNVKKLVRTALTGRKIITIDGCPLACSKACLGNHSLAPDVHFELSGLGVKKRDHEDFDRGDADKIYQKIRERITVAETAA